MHPGLGKDKQWPIEKLELGERLGAHVALHLNVTTVRQTEVRHPSLESAVELVRKYFQIALQFDFVIQGIDDEYQLVGAVAPVASVPAFLPRPEPRS